ncbi:MAG: hypothetical protein AAGF12_05235 [Myxococcota bacterium]
MAPLTTAARADLPWGVRPLVSLREGDVDGDEARELVTLASAGVGIADGFLVSLGGHDVASRMTEVIAQVLAAATEGQLLRIRPMFPSRAVAARLERRAGMRPDVADPHEVAPRVHELLEALGSADARAALGGGLSEVQVRVVAADRSPTGKAASVDPQHGDPEQLWVWERAASPWLVDRRTAQIAVRGQGALDDQRASLAADLADRAQLALGRPVEVDWCWQNGRCRLYAVRPLRLAPAFMPTTFRIVALTAPDEGTVAPMSVDALDKALRTGAEPLDEAVVMRVYARPYRRTGSAGGGVRSQTDPLSFARAAASAARVVADLAAPLQAVRRFEQSLSGRLTLLDEVDLEGLDDDALMRELRTRQALVGEALGLLDRGRAATMTVLTALEAAVGALPRECFPALAQPKTNRARRRVHDRLGRMAHRIEAECGELRGRDRLSTPLQRKWDELRHAVREERPWGLDIRPPPFGDSDDALLAALAAGYPEQDARWERLRKDAGRRLLATARSRPFGRSREGLVHSLLATAGRVTSAKGKTADGLAASLHRQRRAALIAGARLVERALTDEPGDALYMYVAEIGQALAGEPGAYGARVRLRREDDQRWANYAAPRRIDRRQRHSQA